MFSNWLAPLRVKNYRIQWTAALVTVWAIEMEVLILGWYVLTETGSVVLLTLFAASLYTGALVAPLLGVVADRIGHRATLVLMRLTYTVLAATLLAFAYAGALSPVVVLVLAFLNGLVRPSDLAIRSAFIAGTVPADQLSGAMAVERTTVDTARIAGALAGTSLFVGLGMGGAYAVVTTLYAIGVTLTFLIGRSARQIRRVTTEAPPASTVGATAVVSPTTFWHELKEGVAYVRSRPALRAAMWLALLVNLTAFPVSNGLLPYAAREIFHVDAKGLGYLAASFAGGALVGSFAFTAYGRGLPLARLMLGGVGAWYLMLMAFVQATTLPVGMLFLFLAGLAQSVVMISLIVLILRMTDAEFTGRVMGVRILAIYSLPVGLLSAGWLISQIGFPATITFYGLVGLVLVAVIAQRFHGELWTVEAPANAT